MQVETSKTRYIFDLGANTGQNLDYYLSRADVVVAVEANPILCDDLEKKYKEEILDGRLFIVNCVLTDSNEKAGKEIDFFVHNEFPVFSRVELLGDPSTYTKVRVVSNTASKLVRHFLPGNIDPYYIKIDVEGYDSRILRELFNERIFPQFISAESYSVETFSSLVDSCAYQSFNLVEGSRVHQSSWVSSTGANTRFSHHSAGPFGPDLKNPWYDASTFFQFLAYEGLGWKDIHASRFSNECTTSLKNSYLLRKEVTALFFRLYRLSLPATARKRISRMLHRLKSLVS